MIEGLAALYIFMLAGFTGYEIISKVPVILHTPLMSGSNFVHGIVLVGAMIALGIAENPTQQAIGFVAVLLAAGSPGKRAYDVFLDCFKRGALLRPAGDVLVIAPPFIAEKSHIDQLVTTLADSIRRHA